MAILLLPYEIWRPVQGFETLYKISARGNLVSFQRITFIGKRNATKRIRPEYAFIFTKDQDGYLKTILTSDEKKNYFRVHRLVAAAFIPNPEAFPEINHKDLNKENNNVHNLEWCTNLQNIRHCIQYGNRNEKMPRGEHHYKRKRKRLLSL